jgi:hypothetical protein
MSDMSRFGFNAELIEPVSFKPIPAGEYVVVISHSEVKPTKSGSGCYLELTYDVLEGPYANRKIFDRLNIENPNETAQQIALRNLSAICRAVGVMAPKVSEELHDKPFVVKVIIRPPQGEYGESNAVKAYSSIADRKSPATSSPPAVTPKTIASRNKKMPWEF